MTQEEKLRALALKMMSEDTSLAKEDFWLDTTSTGYKLLRVGGVLYDGDGEVVATKIRATRWGGETTKLVCNSEKAEEIFGKPQEM